MKKFFVGIDASKITDANAIREQLAAVGKPPFATGRSDSSLRTSFPSDSIQDIRDWARAHRANVVIFEAVEFVDQAKQSPLPIPRAE